MYSTNFILKMANTSKIFFLLFQSSLDSSHQGPVIQMLPLPGGAEARVSCRHAEHTGPPPYTDSIHCQQHMGSHTAKEL